MEFLLSQVIENQWFSSFFNCRAKRGSFAKEYCNFPGDSLQVIYELKSNVIRSRKMLWGLIPSYSKEPVIKPYFKAVNINGLSRSTTFRIPIRKTRGILVLDSLLVKRGQTEGKKGYRIIRNDSKPFVIPVVFDIWEGTDGPLFSCSIICCPANLEMREFTSSFPGNLDDQAKSDQWMNGENLEACLKAVQGFPNYRLEYYRVNEKLFVRHKNDPAVHRSLNKMPVLFDD